MKTTNETTTTPTFKRGKKVGLNILDLVEGKSAFVEVKGTDIFTSKNYPDGIPYFDVINMETGEEQRLWIDGGMRGALSMMGGASGAVGTRLEIKKGPQKPFETEDGEKVKVNSYEIWTLE